MTSKTTKILTGTSTIEPGYDTYFIDSTAGAMTVTLPTISAEGENYRLKRVDITNNEVTVTGTGGETIDGLVSLPLRVVDELNVVAVDDSWESMSNEGVLANGSRPWLYAKSFPC